MRHVSVLGIGSPFGDDQAGWKVVEKLKNMQWHRRLTIKKLDRPHLQLIDEIKERDIVFIVDAIKSGKKLGSISRLTLDDIKLFKPSISTHDFGVIQSLQLARALNQLPKQLVLFGIEIGEIDKSDKISDEITNAISMMIEMISNELRRDIYARI